LAVGFILLTNTVTPVLRCILLTVPNSYNTTTMMRMFDLIIAIAYFSIPIQLLASLYRYPRLTSMPRRIFVLLVLFALFIFLCGAGHLMRCLGRTDDTVFLVLNALTAFVSLLTALYLLPLVPSVMSALDKGLQDLVLLNAQTEESKRMFMSFLCHEIRNPLFAITSSITFLGDDDLPQEQENMLSNISQSANLMLRLVNDVLDISKLESGKLRVKKHDFDLHKTMEGVASSVRIQVQQKYKGGVVFKYSMAKEVPQIVCGDSVRLLQIAYNMLSNATKFTEKGSIDCNISTVDFGAAVREGLIVDPDVMALESSASGSGYTDSLEEGIRPNEKLSVGLLHSAEEGRHHKTESQGLLKDSANTIVLKIQVTDTGPGIAARRLEGISQPYSHSKLSAYRKHGGTGLGLSVIAELIKIMGGAIHFTSKEHVGSTFVVYIPVTRSDTSNLNALVDPLETLSDSIHQRLPDLGTTVNASGSLSSAQTVSKPKTNPTTPSLATKTRPIKPKLPKYSFPKNDHVVLIVDDNSINRKMLGQMMSSFNIEHAFACDGQEAVDFMLTSRNHTGNSAAPRVGLVFMDLSMPVVDGCQAIAHIRRRGMAVPIVALTANAMEDLRLEALNAGANEFATKPIHRDQLHSKCGQYLLEPPSQPTSEVVCSAESSVDLLLV